MPNPMIFITSGAKGSGKTTFQHQIAKQLQQKGIQIGGFLAFHDFQKDSYSIYNIETEKILKLSQRKPESENSDDPFHFNPHAIMQGRRWITNILNETPDLVIIDEIGIYELNGMVWYDEFTRLCNSSIPLLFSTNIYWLPMIQKKWDINPAYIFYPENFKYPKQAADQIFKWLPH